MDDTREQVTLVRDVEAALIPAGDCVTLAAGNLATITQALGDSYTVVVGGNMYRIAGKDADCLGKKRIVREQAASGNAATREQVGAAAWEQLRTCYDPEIPVNIVELGLVYASAVVPLGASGKWRVEVRMTLTAPGCGMGDFLVGEIEQKLLAIPGVGEANVELVWDPPWTRERMSEAARLELGMLHGSTGGAGQTPAKKGTWILRKVLGR